MRQIPKRKHRRPLYSSTPNGFIAWRLCFLEGFDIYILCLCGVVGVLLSLAFGIVWELRQEEQSDGFAVATDILTLQTLTIGIVQ